MSNLLLITSSLFGDQSKSGQIADEFVDAWRRTHLGTTVVERELSEYHMPSGISPVQTPSQPPVAMNSK